MRIVILFVCMLAAVGLARAEPTIGSESLYEQACARCHENAVQGAPSPDSDDFAERIVLRGRSGLLDSILQGRKRMSKRGGCFTCSDEELESLLDLMLLINKRQGV